MSALSRGWDSAMRATQVMQQAGASLRNTETASQPGNRRRCPAGPHGDCCHRTQTPATKTDCQDRAPFLGPSTQGTWNCKEKTDTWQEQVLKNAGKGDMQAGLDAPHPLPTGQRLWADRGVQTSEGGALAAVTACGVTSNTSFTSIRLRKVPAK